MPQCRPGEEVEITGIYTNNFDASLNTRQGFPVFATVLEANYVQKQKDIMSMYKLTEENKREIIALSKDPNIGERVRLSNNHIYFHYVFLFPLFLFSICPVHAVAVALGAPSIRTAV